jgi:alpha-glucosidase
LTWRTLGGNIDLYFYAGPTIEDATKSYQHTVGFPAMHQYWTLGYHSCSPAYSNWSQVEQSVAEYEKFRTPLETQWMDFDYMNELRNFELAPGFNKDDEKRLMDKLHASGRHYLEIVDSGIYVPNPNYASDLCPPYDRGHAANIFMLNPDGSEYLGAVWPGYTVFPDRFAENASIWWAHEITRNHDDISFDGIWMDMNEASSFCVGSCGTGDLDFNPFVIADSEAGTPGWPEGFANTNASEAASAFSSLSSYSATAAPKPTTTGFLPHTEPTPGLRNINYRKPCPALPSKANVLTVLL